MANVIPPDTRAPGQTGHIDDHNDIADVLSALQGQLQAVPAFTYGQATLVAGSVTINDTSLTANSLPLHSRISSGGTTGTITAQVIPGVSITFSSTSASETSTIAYLILN